MSTNPADQNSHDDADTNGDHDDKKTTPPWGDDFDAERAWTLVQNLRSDLKKVKDERDTLATERQAREDEGKPELEKLTGRLTKVEQDFKDAQRALFVERALRKHSISEDLVEFLTGDSEEEILAKAERLASLNKGKSDDDKDDKDGEQELDDAGRPKAALRPGHGGDSPAPFDADAIAKAARERTH